MDHNGFYSFDQSTLQGHAATDFFVPDEDSTSQHNPFTLDTTGQSSGNSDSLDRYLDSWSRPCVCRTTTNNFGPLSNANATFGSPNSLAQTTLQLGSMFPQNITHYQDGFTTLDTDASFHFSQLGHIFEKPQGSLYSASPSGLAQFTEMYSPDAFWSTQPTSTPLFSCDWPGCTSAELFKSQIAQSQHVSAIHVPSVLQDTSGFCTWPGCTKSKLDTSKKLESHVFNIHIEPLRCTIKGCRRAEPFGRKGDLERHIASVHKKERTWKCLRKSCIFQIKGFPRKDKLNEHMRTMGHGAFRCQYSHCGKSAPDFAPFLTDEELSLHYDDDHGNFECGIGLCANTSSAFTPRTLRSHVFHFHCSRRMDYENVSAIVYQISERSQRNACTVTESDFDGLHISNTCKECTDAS